MDFTALKSTLNIKLGDTDNFAFTSEEKDELLNEAIQDPYAVSEVSDESLSYVTGTSSYNVPATITNVTGIGIKVGTEDPESVALSWDVYGGVIKFKGGSSIIPNGSTLYLSGYYKYTVDDTISEVRVQQYVLNLAQLNAMDQLGVKKLMRFVKNDASVSEMIAVKRELERRVSQHRANIQRRFQVV